MTKVRKMTHTYHHRRRNHYREREQRAFGRGFLLGFLIAAFLFVTAAIGAEKAYGHHLTAQAKPIHKTLHGGKAREPLPHPRVVRALLLVGKCEQPAPRGAGYYANIRWDAFPGKTWPGGMGIMQIHHEKFRPKGTPKDPTKATPAQQLRVAWRAYKYYRAEGRRLGYGDGTRYGSTFWECSRKMRPAFRGVSWDNKTVLWG
jgi:hypothetical protein